MMTVKSPSDQEIKTTENWGTWSKEPSEFAWFYDEKETCFILEGKAIVTSKDGKHITFKKGDWVVFEQGLECTWTIIDTIKKKYKFG
ncbi:MAG: cupin domain-containing protein [Bacteroidales bacterium]|nr:cupin domain-containing protein [Bacteroidales bacterium]